VQGNISKQSKIKDSYDRKNGYGSTGNMWNSKRISLLAEKRIILTSFRFGSLGLQIQHSLESEPVHR